MECFLLYLLFKPFEYMQRESQTSLLALAVHSRAAGKVHSQTVQYILIQEQITILTANVYSRGRMKRQGYI